MKLDSFDGTNFTRGKKKMKLLLTTLKIFYVLDPNLMPISESSDGDTDGIKALKMKCEDDELM